jgi:hypothetical protein
MVSIIQKEGMIALKVAQYMGDVKTLQEQLAGGGAPPPDPVVELKKQELDQRAKADEADAAAKEKSLAIEQAKVEQTGQVNANRIKSQDEIANERADIARERLAIMEQQMLGQQQQAQGDNNAA